MPEQITKGIVLRYMREALKIYNCNPHSTLITKTIQNMIEANILERPSENVSSLYNHYAHRNPELEKLLVECYTFLIIQGIIIPASTTPNFGGTDAWNNFRITKYGEEWASSEGEPIPEDVDGFIKFIKNAISGIDEVVLQYITESLNTFNSNYIFASAVMLGAASEKLIYILAEALLNSSIINKLKKDISDALQYRKLKASLDLASIAINSLIEQEKIPYNIHEGSNHYLATLFDAIRIQRNDAVHPIAGKISKGQLRLLLLAFPHACKKAYDFLNWLKENEI